jgi:hypothetical protein
MNNNSQQRLFWSVSRPLKYMGLTLDEWAVSLVGVFPGIYLLNSGQIKFGFFSILSGMVLCWMFKKYKRLSQSFKPKSFLIAKGFLPAPTNYPKLLKKNKVGR